MNLQEIKYSTKPITLGDMILIKKIQDNADPMAISGLIQNRTNLIESEALDLDADDMMSIVQKIVDAMHVANTLQEIGSQLK